MEPFIMPAGFKQSTKLWAGSKDIVGWRRRLPHHRSIELVVEGEEYGIR